MEHRIIYEITSSKNAYEAEKVIEKHLPGWLIVSLEDYSADYPHLKQNWKTICDQIGTTPKKIILVDNIPFDPEPTLINKICEYLTLQGYVVRISTQFVPCSVCEKAIPVEDIWRVFKEKGLSVPETWSRKCSGC